MKGCHLEKWLIAGSVLYAIFGSNFCAAQVVGDTTLPAGETSQVTGNPNFQIDGGARRGSNLFHSFSQFSIPTGSSAFFNNALDVQNILTRVTGGSISNIDGVIGANGSANLFLINPNGIIFGPNASLNIGGSFVGSTASSIQFADGTEFSAVNPSDPPLLTISVPTGLQFNGQQGDIVRPTPQNPVTEAGDAGQLLGTAQPINQATDATPSISGNLDNPNDVDLYQLYLEQGIPFRATTVNGSQVDTQLFLFDGNGLGLATNNNSFNGFDSSYTQSTIPSEKGHFIPAVSGTYYLGISSYKNNPRSSQDYIFEIGLDSLVSPQFPLSEWDSNAGTDSGPYTIALHTQTPILRVQPGRTLALIGGNISLQSGYFQASGGRVELGGVTGSGTVGLNVNGNTLHLNFPNQLARADVSLNGSAIDVTGANGSIRVVARNIDILNNSKLQMGIPKDLRFPDTRTGDMDLNATGSITLRNYSSLQNILMGQGMLGNINLIAGARVSLGNNSPIAHLVDLTGVGNTGDINITTGSLSLTTSRVGLQVFWGQGNTGNVNINARDSVSFSDYSSVDIDNWSSSGGTGDINITTGSLSLTESMLLIMQEGANAGDININARSTVSLMQGSNLISRVFSWEPHNAVVGSVNIDAGDGVSIDDSGISTVLTGNNPTKFETVPLSSGSAGAINITTGVLSITNGGRLHSYTDGTGYAGNVTINAGDRVLIDGAQADDDPILMYTSSFYEGPSQISTGVIRDDYILSRQEVGQGGDVTIKTGSLFLTNGGAINTTTQFKGNAGNVTIDASDAVEIRGRASFPFDPASTNYSSHVIAILNALDGRSGIATSAQADSVGDGGYVRITTGSLSVSDQGTIRTTAQGQGRAGNIQIRASDAISLDGVEVTSTLDAGAVGRGGDINIAARSVSLLNGAQLAASTAGEGVAGNITLSADMVGLGSGGRLLTITSSDSRAGNITVNTPDLQLSGATSGLFTETISAGDAGNLTIQPRGNGQSVRVNLQDGAQISASTQGSGNGGELTITAPQSITLTGNGSVIAAETGGSGTGGNLNLQTGTLNIQNQAQVTVSSSDTGSAGSLFVEANQIYLDNHGRIRADTSGGGGNINLRSPLIVLRNGSSISTNATGINIPGGNININTDNLVAVPKENSDITANSQDFRGGNVTIRASGIFGIEFRERVTPLSDITATGISEGTVNIITPGIDPARGLAALPTEVVDVSNAIATACRDVQGSSFVVTGRGGLPPTPQQALGDDPRWRDWRTPAVVSRQPHAPGNATLPPSINPPSNKSALVEATGWVIEPDGKVILTASAPHVTSPNRWGQPVNCDRS
jgi:filamentous hemagglutinin family protein